MVRKKKSACSVLLIVVLVFAAEMLAVAAWAQDKGGKTSQEETQSKKASQTKVQTKETARTSDSPESKVAAKNPSAKKALEAAQTNQSNDLDNGIVDEAGNPINSIDISNVDDCTIDSGDNITFQVTGNPPAGV